MTSSKSTNGAPGPAKGPSRSLRVGILGAGQLARMMAVAGESVNMKCFVLADKPVDCAIPKAAGFTLNDKNPETLKKFCRDLDILTIENEFVDLNWLKMGMGETPLYPKLDCLGLIQDKLAQKNNLLKKNIPCLEFITVNSPEDLEKARETFGPHLVLKTARFGYDGKGTFIFDGNNKFDAQIFWKTHGKAQGDTPEGFRGYAEPVATFEKELAVIVARSVSGEVISYPVIETNQEGGICRWAMAPAEINPQVALRARELAVNAVKAFDGVGVFGVEMFLLPGGQVVVNEMAPRVHNSGHLTMDGCEVGQFAMHLKAVAGSPLKEQKLLWPGMAMANIIGTKKSGNPRLSPDQLAGKATDHNGTWVHWYGKTGETVGRKLGHINARGSSARDALKKALASLEHISA